MDPSAEVFYTAESLPNKPYKYLTTTLQNCKVWEGGKRKRRGGPRRLSGLDSLQTDQSAIGRTLPSLIRFSTTSAAMFFGTASYCLKIIVKEPRPWVTVRIAFE